jgi:hypothetical protein
MPALNESQQVGTPESWLDLIANADIGECPVTSMLKKSQKKSSEDTLTHWSVEQHRPPNLKGTPDLKDVSKFNAKKRKKLYGIRMKTRDGVAVGDLASLNTVMGVPDEMAAQVDEALIVVKRSIEGRALSSHDCIDEDDGDEGTETRGMGSWLSTTAQTTLPVPDGYRPGQTYAGTLAAFDEDTLINMSKGAFKERKGTKEMLGIVGIDMRDKMDRWLSHRSDVTNKHAVLSVNQSYNKEFIQCVDRIVLNSATIDLMTSSFMLLSNEEEAEETAGSHMNGFFICKDMWNLDFSRDIRVMQLENKGGGPRAFVDAVWCLECLNPLGQFATGITAAS